MYCTVCGELLPEGVVNGCPHCGADLRNVRLNISNNNVNNDSSIIFGIFGFIFAAISLFFLPPVFGGLGIWFGTIVRKKGNLSIGLVLIILSTVLMIAGMIIGFLVGYELGFFLTSD